MVFKALVTAALCCCKMNEIFPFDFAIKALPTFGFSSFSEGLDHECFKQG